MAPTRDNTPTWRVLLMASSCLFYYVARPSQRHHYRCRRPSHHDPLICIDRPTFGYALQWLHNESDGVSYHQPLDCLLNRLFMRRSKKTSKLCVTDLLWGEFTGDRWIPHTKGQLRGKCFHLMTSSRREMVVVGRGCGGRVVELACHWFLCYLRVCFLFAKIPHVLYRVNLQCWYHFRKQAVRRLQAYHGNNLERGNLT